MSSVAEVDGDKWTAARWRRGVAAHRSASPRACHVKSNDHDDGVRKSHDEGACPWRAEERREKSGQLSRGAFDGVARHSQTGEQGAANAWTKPSVVRLCGCQQSLRWSLLYYST